MKPVGEPDAGNPHVRFDERGWETERCITPQPRPSSTLPASAARENPAALIQPTPDFFTAFQDEVSR